MHVAMDEIDFSAYVLTIGDGTAEQHPEIGKDMIKVPQEYLVDTLDALIKTSLMATVTNTLLPSGPYSLQRMIMLTRSMNHQGEVSRYWENISVC